MSEDPAPYRVKRGAAVAAADVRYPVATDEAQAVAGSRGEQTRDALVAAAVQIFGRDGFHAASTRAIAGEAGVNQALIGYHFGGKQGLYDAAVDYIQQQMVARIAPGLGDLVDAVEDAPKYTQQRSLLAANAMADLACLVLEALAEASRHGWVRLILREQQDPGPAMDHFYEGGMGRVLDIANWLAAEASGMNADSELCRARSLMLMGQVLVFVTARGTVRHLLHWDDLEDEQIELLKTQLRKNIPAMFATEAQR